MVKHQQYILSVTRSIIYLSGQNVAVATDFYARVIFARSRDIVFGIAGRLLAGTQESHLIPGRDKRLFSKASRVHLDPTHSPI